MAKARDIAALAGLAGMAYAMRNKDKGTTDSNPTRAARPESTETREDKVADEGYKNDVLKTITQKREGPNDQAGNQGVLGGDKPKSGSKPISKSKPELQSFTTRKDPREAEAGMSRGTRSVPNDNYSNEGRSSAKPPSTVSSSAEGMKNYKPRRNSTPANTASSSAEGMKNYKPRVTPPAAPFKGGQPGYDEAGNFLGGRRGYDEAGNPMKKGGAVKKMASGGMTASRRADGIATRGKTKCKMY